jgi:hypothetical protein
MARFKGTHAALQIVTGKFKYLAVRPEHMEGKRLFFHSFPVAGGH